MSAIHNNAIRVKKINVQIVKNALKAAGTGTKATIAGITGLSVATCGTILNELLETGEVVESDIEEPSGGRPARRYKYNADFSYIACLFVRTEGGIHSISYTVANLIGDTVEEEGRLLDHIGYASIESLVDELLEKHGNIKAIGIGIPGVVHKGIVGVCDAEALVGMPLGPKLKQKFGLEVTIENDMHLTALGFYNMQSFDENKTFAVVAFPKHHFPGAGFIVDGQMLKGNTMFSGEVSFLAFGMEREEQLKRWNGPDGFMPLAVKTIVSIIAIINPAAIAITGDLSHPSHRDEIYNGCLKDIPREHMPELFVQNDTREQYLNGLIAVTLESLSYHLQLIEKRAQR